MVSRRRRTITKLHIRRVLCPGVLSASEDSRAVWVERDFWEDIWAWTTEQERQAVYKLRNDGELAS